jgi:Flp pilus assembly protein TadD
LRPGELPATADPARYLEAAAAFEKSAKPQDSELAFDAAVKHWPDDPVAWVGRGTASYRSGDLNAAANDYARALSLDDSQAGARNNLAMTLLELGCAAQAREQLEKIDNQQLTGPLGESIQDTRAQVAAREPALNEESCRRRPAL